MSEHRTGVELPPGVLRPLDLDLAQTGPLKSVRTSIGKKYLMGWTGLFWCFFVFVHLLENLAVFLGQDAYNWWAAVLMSLGPVLYIMEAGVVVFLVLHVVLAVLVTLENWKARPVSYEVDRKKGGRTVSSSTMIWTGLLVLVFMVLHLIDLKYGDHVQDAAGRVDLYTAVRELLSQPGHAVWYVVAVCLLGLHVSHGLQSGLRTIGLGHDRYTPAIDRLSRAFGLLVAVGYTSIPVWAILTKGGAQ